MCACRQVEGKGGLTKLFAKLKANGPSTLFHGSLAAAAATFVGHYPWFFVYNYLSENLPSGNGNLMVVGRIAVKDFIASAICDTCSNSIRVIKVYKQTNTDAFTYPEALRRVVKEDGVAGLFGRGLQTKIIATGLRVLMIFVLEYGLWSCS